MPQPPSGTVTFLFTDMEDSTRLWEERPDEMRGLVAAHDEILREAIGSHDGYVFATGGDGFAVAFGRAADAVAAAEEAQAAASCLEHVKVRMGINTGEVHEREGDYFGPAVNRTARLMAAGHGGQVLISAVTVELVPGLVLKNLGEHRLRDLGSPMLVWQLGTDEFPPLRTLDELPGNLPVQRTSFIGRTDEVKELATLVGTERLVTLTGPGGVGKSRLALQVAAEAAPAFGDGAWCASLAALEEGALAAAAVLEALGVPERQGEAALDTLCIWASTRQALVVIDNCEHLLTDVALVVDQMLEASTTISLLATSQAPLDVRGEHVWAVAPLSGPSGVAGDSVELFVDRARMARADFALTDDNETAVLEICERLDHLPLAIELAAARVRGMVPADIARRLDQRLRLLASSDTLIPGRHRTLDAAVRWSYELLDATQRRVFDRLSVLAGGFTIEAAEALVAGDGVDEWEVLDAILALVDKSLVVADQVINETRYRLLETMRQFGQANLEADVVLERYRNRHGEFYAEFVFSRRPKLYGSPSDLAALTEIERDLENIRLALRQAADDHTSSRFEELFSSLYVLLLYRGRTSEGVSWAGELLGRPNLDPAIRIATLGYAASMIHHVDLARGKEMAEAADALWVSTGAALPVMAISVLSVDAMMQGDTEAAIAACDRVLDLAGSEPDPFLRTWVLGTTCAVLAICGAIDRVEDLRNEYMEKVEQLDNRFLMAATGGLAPFVYYTDPDGAGEFLHRAFDLHDEIGYHGGNATIAMFLALQELRGGDSAAAAHWATRSLQLAVNYAPAFIAQTISTTVAITRRHSPEKAAVLLGALRAHRTRKHQAGSPPEIEAEARYEHSLRRTLSDQFDPLYLQGAALNEPDMIALAFAQLDTVTEG